MKNNPGILPDQLPLCYTKHSLEVKVFIINICQYMYLCDKHDNIINSGG